MDLRDYLVKLDSLGELKRIDKEVHWNLEAAAITTLNYLQEGPALLFTNITGYPKDYSLASSIFAGKRNRLWRRLALILNMPSEMEYEDFMDEVIKRSLRPIKPIIVSTGLCKENIHIGDEVNLLEFPFPYLHAGDGGRYGTLQTVINKDPDSSWVNWGNYRAMIHTKDKMGGLFTPGQHMPDLYYRKYEARNKSMPFCMAIGGDPVLNIAATFGVPEGVSEVDIAGAMRLEPIELIKAETNNLFVPANAEIIIEGEVLPHERWDEGPFGEFTGFMQGPRLPRPVYRVHAITHRNNPIIPFVVEGMRMGDSMCLGATTYLGSMIRALRLRGWPVKTVYAGYEALWCKILVVTEVPYPGYADEVANFLFSDPKTSHIDWVMIVDSHVDYQSTDAFLENLGLKTHPTKFRITDMDAPRNPLNAYLASSEKRIGQSAKIYVDATWPKTWAPSEVPQKPSFKDSYPESVRKWVEESWKEIFSHFHKK